jgi:hypothetical protein
MSLNLHPDHQLTLEEVRDVMLDVQRMLEQYELQTGLRFGTVVMISSGPITSFSSTLPAEPLVVALRSLIERIERDELGEHVCAPAQPIAH